MLRKFLLTTAIVAVSGLAANAADMVTIEERMDPVAPATGSGGYLFSIEGGWASIHLPDVKIGATVSPNAPFGLIDTFGVSKNELVGYRLGAAVHTPETQFLGMVGRFGITGFYAGYGHGGNKENCTPVPGVTLCEMFAPEDLGPGFDMTTNTFAAELDFDTDRGASEWGVAVEAVSGPVNGINFSAGVAFRRLSDNFKADVMTEDGGTPTIAEYHQDFSTDYWGVFVGADGSMALGNDLFLNLGGEAGVYYAHSNLDLDFESDQGDFAAAAIDESLSDSNNEIAYILSGRAELAKRFGTLELAGYVQGDFYSYAPEIKYNTTDATTAVGSIGGGQSGTEIGNGSAMSWTAGVVLRASF